MLIVDGPAESTEPVIRYPAVPMLHDRLSDDSVILLDDADGTEEERIVALWLEQFEDLTAEKLPLENGAHVIRKRKATLSGEVPDR